MDIFASVKARVGVREAAAKIPRVIKMAEEEMAAETHKRLGFFKNGDGLPEA